MALASKGSRRIVVDDRAYRWSVRKRNTYSQQLEHAPMSFAVELEHEGLRVLRVSVDCMRPRSYFSSHDAAITPAVVERAIRQALHEGWTPTVAGGAHALTLALAADATTPEPSSA